MDDDDRRIVRLHLQYLTRTSAREETKRHRRDGLRRLREATGVPLLEVTAEQLEAWQDGLRRRRLAPASVRAYTSNVREFYRWAHHVGHLAENPAAELAVPKVPFGRPHPIAEDDLSLALRCAPDTYEQPLRTWLVLAAFCGARAGEIARLRVEDVGEDVLDLDGKGGKWRTVPLPAPVREMVLAHMGRVASGPIWRTRTGAPVRPDAVSQRCCTFLRSVGITVSLHKLRHRYGTAMYGASKDLVLRRRGRRVARRLGAGGPARGRRLGGPSRCAELVVLSVDEQRRHDQIGGELPGQLRALLDAVQVAVACSEQDAAAGMPERAWWASVVEQYRAIVPSDPAAYTEPS